MKIENDANLSMVIFHRLRNLNEKIKDKEVITFFERTELSEIVLDVQDLYASLLEIWRFTKVK